MPAVRSARTRNHLLHSFALSEQMLVRPQAIIGPSFSSVDSTVKTPFGRLRIPLVETRAGEYELNAPPSHSLRSGTCPRTTMRWTRHTLYWMP